MEVKCQHCGSTVDEKSQTCPICGTQLPRANKAPSEWPKTIEELMAWYTDHHLPPEDVTRFFIGKNITEPRAFGIYKNEVGEIVVYKNKNSGERAIRYQGMNEAFAVGEIYQKLRDEMAKQRSRSRAKKSVERAGSGNVSTLQSTSKPAPRKSRANRVQAPQGGKKKKNWLKIGIISSLVAFGVGAVALTDYVPNGYYLYNGTEYYHQGSSWYRYNPESDFWYEAESMSDIITGDNAEQYQYSGHEGTAFEDTEYYYHSSSNDSDDDDDNDWGDDDWDDDDDWDNSSTDFDDDW